MHPDFLQMALHDNARELDRRVQDAYLNRTTETPEQVVDTVVLRLCTVQDDEALDQLAALEGKRSPKGRHVVAEVDGVVVAAVPLGLGSALADPFRATAHLLPLLELRARQLAPAVRHRHGLPLWTAVRGTIGV